MASASKNKSKKNNDISEAGEIKSRWLSVAPKKRNVKLIVRNVILVILAVVMAVSGSGFIYYYNSIDSMNYSDSGTFGDVADFDESGNFIVCVQVTVYFSMNKNCTFF